MLVCQYTVITYEPVPVGKMVILTFLKNVASVGRVVVTVFQSIELVFEEALVCSCV